MLPQAAVGFYKKTVAVSGGDVRHRHKGLKGCCRKKTSMIKQSHFAFINTWD
jgi:hypothetical protein